MNDFTGYIENGKGRGLIYFLIVSAFLSIIFGINVNYRLQNAVKDKAVTDYIARMPSFTIQNGEVTEPKNTYVFVPFVEGEQDGFILDTTDSPQDQLTFANGVYVTKKKAYFKTMDDIQELSLSNVGNLNVTPETMRHLLSKIVSVAASLYALFLFGVLWVGYGILYVVVKLFFLILGRTTCPFIRGRSVFVAWSAILILDFILFALGYGFSVATAFALALILAIFIVFRTPLHSMDVEQSLQALGNATAQEDMDFLDRELTKKSGKNITSDATEMTLAQMKKDEAQDESKPARAAGGKRKTASVKKVTKKKAPVKKTPKK